MTQKTITISGWILTGVLGLLFVFSAAMKLFPNEEAIAQSNAMGFDAGTMKLLGIVEIGSLILFIIPRTGVLGALLLVSYLGGAIATHLQHGQPATMPVVAQILVWVASVFRFPEITGRIFPSFKKYWLKNNRFYTCKNYCRLSFATYQKRSSEMMRGLKKDMIAGQSASAKTVTLGKEIDTRLMVLPSSSIISLFHSHSSCNSSLSIDFN